MLRELDRSDYATYKHSPQIRPLNKVAQLEMHHLLSPLTSILDHPGGISGPGLCVDYHGSLPDSKQAPRCRKIFSAILVLHLGPAFTLVTFHVSTSAWRMLAVLDEESAI